MHVPVAMASELEILCLPVPLLAPQTPRASGIILSCWAIKKHRVRNSVAAVIHSGARVFRPTSNLASAVQARALGSRARGWSGSTLSFGTQLGDSLYERRVGGKVIPRDADALDPLCEFLQKALPSQCVAASGSGPEPRRRHPPPIRPRWSRRRPAVAAPPCLARRWRHACRRLAAAKQKERRL